MKLHNEFYINLLLKLSSLVAASKAKRDLKTTITAVIIGVLTVPISNRSFVDYSLQNIIIFIANFKKMTLEYVSKLIQSKEYRG